MVKNSCRRVFFLFLFVSQPFISCSQRTKDSLSSLGAKQKKKKMTKGFNVYKVSGKVVRQVHQDFQISRHRGRWNMLKRSIQNVTETLWLPWYWRKSITKRGRDSYSSPRASLYGYFFKKKHIFLYMCFGLLPRCKQYFRIEDMFKMPPTAKIFLVCACRMETLYIMASKCNLPVYITLHAWVIMLVVCAVKTL